nr:hypothetical protein [Mycoplasmopsis bovis]
MIQVIFKQLLIGETVVYDRNKIHFGYFVENFLTKENGWEKFKEFCLAYSGAEKEIQNYNFAKWMVNETKTFLAILDKNKDLAFNPDNWWLYSRSYNKLIL